MRRANGCRRIEITRMKNQSRRKVTFSKRLLCLFKKVSELCTLCGAYVGVVIFSSTNNVYSCGHPSVEFIVDKVLGENPQPTDAPNPIIGTYQNININEIN
ncbi:hypothetical protein MTR67_043326 [Solanum verrucosum]|uniref:MADS-box domain-containing protein n=1 Tax=Solanum verrucosum TaxID=315347 RepID=A0AAF0UR55_SOLVR|nr:hypothetical protein MTR67_043326 [Solanum verrucosum]